MNSSVLRPGQIWQSKSGVAARVVRVDDTYVWYEINECRGIHPCIPESFIDGCECVAENATNVVDFAAKKAVQ